METRLAALVRRKAEVDTSLKRVGLEMAALLRLRCKARARASRAWRLPERVVRTALIVYVLAGYAVEPVIVFLRNAGRSRQWPDLSDPDLAAMIEQLFLDACEHDLAALTDEADPLDDIAMQVALRYVREWLVVSWDARLNVDRNCTERAHAC